MISWATILFGAAVTLVLVAAAQQFIARRSPATVICAAAASAAAVIAWNAILGWRHHPPEIQRLVFVAIRRARSSGW